MIFIEIDTEYGVQTLNVADIMRIAPGLPAEDGTQRCWIVTSKVKWHVQRKSYIAILALLRAAGATLVTGSQIPGAPHPINP